MFTKIQPRSVSDQIVDQVISAIFNAKLAPGAKLPSERSLSAAFGVGRQAVREAMSKLQAMGLITVRKPKGAFVQLPASDVLRQSLLRILTDQDGSVEKAFRIRKQLEGRAVAPVLERDTEPRRVPSRSGRRFPGRRGV